MSKLVNTLRKSEKNRTVMREARGDVHKEKHEPPIANQSQELLTDTILTPEEIQIRENEYLQKELLSEDELLSYIAEVNDPQESKQVDDHIEDKRVIKYVLIVIVLLCVLASPLLIFKMEREISGNTWKTVKENVVENTQQLEPQIVRIKGIMHDSYEYMKTLGTVVTTEVQKRFNKKTDIKENSNE